ncbi:MAG: hypothetical protein HY791_00160 [Deltaproteobacteria bacterium]|nr:hypothetical protein [Deltaproteobacteria bacterium]
MSDDERPRKSWREIDAGRDRKSQRSRSDPAERARSKQAETQAYRSYKSQLDKLFTPGGAPLPPSLADKLGPASEEAKRDRELLDALAKSPGAETLRAVVTANVSLPSDPRLLVQLLDVREAALAKIVLERLLSMIEDENKRPNKALALQRIESLLNLVDDEEVAALAASVRAVL